MWASRGSARIRRAARPAAGLLAVLLVAAAACGNGGGAVDAAPDPPDAEPAEPDAPPGRCGTDVFLTGEYVEWDSTVADFDGIEFADWAVRGEPARATTTNPNGRVELCIAAARLSLIDVTKTDYVSALFLADPEVFTPPGTYFSARGFTAEKAAAFYDSLGLVFDGDRAHVLVHRQGAAIPLTLSLGGMAFAAPADDPTAWSPGTSGGLVLFANIERTDDETTLSSTSAFVGPTVLPLEAGTLTMTSIR
jgi:hypothetical protein